MKKILESLKFGEHAQGSARHLEANDLVDSVGRLVIDRETILTHDVVKEVASW